MLKAQKFALFWNCWNYERDVLKNVPNFCKKWADQCWIFFRHFQHIPYTIAVNSAQFIQNFPLTSAHISTRWSSTNSRNHWINRSGQYLSWVADYILGSKQDIHSSEFILTLQSLLFIPNRENSSRLYFIKSNSVFYPNIIKTSNNRSQITSFVTTLIPSSRRQRSCDRFGSWN